MNSGGGREKANRTLTRCLQGVRESALKVKWIEAVQHASQAALKSVHRNRNGFRRKEEDKKEFEMRKINKKWCTKKRMGQALTSRASLFV